MTRNSRFEITRLVHSTAYAMKSTHSHSYYEIFYLDKGECSLQVGNTVYELKKGNLALIMPDFPHKTAYTALDINERICIEFTSDHLKSLYDIWGEHWVTKKLSPFVIELNEAEQKNILTLLEKLLEEKSSKDPYSQVISKTVFFELLIYLMRYNRTSISGRTTNDYNHNMEMALDYINKNYTRKITLAEVAKVLHLNTSYFSKQFKTINGVGFSEYVSNLRIIRSEKLLLETNKSITEIAFECGFENSNYYGDVFRKKYHMSPSDFRKIKGNIQ